MAAACRHCNSHGCGPAGGALAEDRVAKALCAPQVASEELKQVGLVAVRAP
eukprot:CAMPEP_0179114474 /NCGR_PEP_ID=MMETSP0796-20121207/53605_1 /TAXON_ID=73915 /ORGANISM="Pyrodinium bahamense, Strain pbaha01" /LENGTH=50 /DNA_ID=CAMNT_0020812699 /DNA_START=258 /DNA_END=407 /DNA_ORIENTATION=-